MFRKIGKKVLSFFIALTMVLSLLPASAFAASWTINAPNVTLDYDVDNIPGYGGQWCELTFTAVINSGYEAGSGFKIEVQDNGVMRTLTTSEYTVSLDGKTYTSSGTIVLRARENNGAMTISGVVPTSGGLGVSVSYVTLTENYTEVDRGYFTMSYVSGGVSQSESAPVGTGGDELVVGSEVETILKPDTGKVLTPSDVTINTPSTITQDGKNVKVTFTVPNYDVVITAEAKDPVPVTNEISVGLSLSHVTVAEVEIGGATASVADFTDVTVGDTVKITFVPDVDYTLNAEDIDIETALGITVENVVKSTDASDRPYISFTAPNADVTVTAAAAKVITAPATTVTTTLTNATVTGAGMTYTDGGSETNEVLTGSSPYVVRQNSSVYFVIAPDTGYQLSAGDIEVTGATSSSVTANADGSFTVQASVGTAAVVITAAATAIPTDQITATLVLTNATYEDFYMDDTQLADGLTSTSLTIGSEVAITVTPDTDYVFNNVEVVKATNGAKIRGVEYIENRDGSVDILFTAPDYGIKIVANAVSQKTDTTTTLKYNNGLTLAGATLDELETYSFKAEVAGATGGFVQFTFPDGTVKRAEVAYDGTAQVEWTVPSSVIGTGKEIKAEFLGSETLNTSSATATVDVATKTLSATDASIVANPGDTSLKAQTQYTLSVTGVKDTLGNALTENTDYTVKWYVKANGGEYIPCTSTVKPLNTSYVYKAVVSPKGTYKFGAFELVIACGQLFEPTVTVNYTPATVYEGKDVTITAQVNAAGGFVTFYATDAASNVIRLGEASLVNEEAEITINNLPAGEYTVKAVYSGVEGIYASADATKATLTIKSATLPATTWEIDVTAGTLENSAMVPFEAYTLEVATSDEAAALTYGTDYSITWLISKDAGLTWETYGDVKADGSIDVTPQANSWQYAAIVYPMGNYTKPENGISVGKITCGDNVADTDIELTVDNNRPFENEMITLTATATSNGIAVIGGTFTFYKGTDEIAVVAVDSAGMARITVPAPAYSEGTVTYKAVYSGTDTYAGGDDTVNVRSKSTAINKADIVIYDSIGTQVDRKTTTVGSTIVPAESITQGEEYTLKVENVTSLDDTALTYGTDYIVEWYADFVGNGNFELLYGTNELKITAENTAIEYKAIVKPIGSYEKPAQGLELQVKNSGEKYDTAVTLDAQEVVTDYFVEALGAEAQFEGKEIKLVAHVTADHTSAPLVTGYVNFYQNGVLINQTPVAVVEGYAEITVPMAAYDTTKAAADNFDNFTVKYSENNVFDGTDNTSAPVKVYRMSAKLDVPVISVEYGSVTETTATDNVTGLPTQTEITLTLLNPTAVKALDGRTYGSESYDIQWQNASNGSTFVDIAGETTVLYKFQSDIAGEAYRIALLPKGNMTDGNVSKLAVIGTKITPAVDLEVGANFEASAVYADKFHTAVTAAEAIDGAHYGDKVTMNITVTAPAGSASRPTGYVRLSYEDEAGTVVTLGEVELLATSDVLVSTAMFETEALPEGVLEVTAEYLGDSSYNGNSDTEEYKVWSVNISNDTASPYGTVTINAYEVIDGITSTTPIPAGTDLISDRTYVIKLENVYTEDGELLVSGMLNGTEYKEFTVVWQVRDVGTTEWRDVSDWNGQTEVYVTPTSSKCDYRAIVSTTNHFYNYNNDSLKDEEISNVIGSQLRNAKVVVTLDKTESFQETPVTIYAKVTPADAQPGVPTGTVQFFYSVDGTTWTAITADDPTIDSTKVEINTTTNTASIVTSTLPVKADGTYQKLAVKAVYSGDANYNPAESDYTVDNSLITIFSSVVDAETVKIYTADGNPLEADGADIYIILGDIYTLDNKVTPNADIAERITLLTLNTDYTVEWQYCANYSSGVETWRKVEGSSSTEKCLINPAEDTAYRAVITVTETSDKVKASYKMVAGPVAGAQQYTSNELVVGRADSVIYTNIVPGTSGALEGDDVAFNVYVYGGSIVPTGSVTVSVKDENGTEVFTGTNNIVNGYNSIVWADAPGGIYEVTTTYSSNNEYIADPVVEEYIVRFNDHAISVPDKTVVYNGEHYKYTAADVTVTGITNVVTDIEQMAKDDVAYTYFYIEEDGSETWVDFPTEAGTYKVKAWLPESEYWTEKTDEATLTIEKRTLEISEIVILDKVYDGTTNVDILKVELKDAAQSSVTGLPTGNTGVVEDDSVYVILEAALDSANAGDRTLTVTGVEILGPSADNYTMAPGYTQTVTVERNQLYGEMKQGITLKAGTLITAEDIKLIDQSGADFTKYKVTYYLHTGSGIEKVTDTNTKGKYTVVVSPTSDNYKGGASATVYVGDTAVAGTFSGATYASTIVSISDTEVEYNGAVQAPTITLTNGATVVAVQYYANGTGVNKVKDAGRYLVSVLDSTGRVTRGIFTIHKSAQTPGTLTVDDSTYGDGYGYDINYTGDLADFEYCSFVGGRLTDAEYFSPVDAGEYLATYYFAATKNYIPYEASATFTIAKKALTITAENRYVELFSTNPVLVAEYTGFEYKDSSVSDALVVKPTMEIEARNGFNHDLNNVGGYTITPSLAASHNYDISYVSADLTAIVSNPRESFAIVGVPEGTIQYGDEFRLAAYGNKSGGLTTDSSRLTWTSSNPAVATIDQQGNVKVVGVGTTTITLTKGVAGYQITTTVDITSEKKVVDVIIDDVDYVYDGTPKRTSDDYDFEVLVNGDTRAKSDCDVYFEPETDTGNYWIVAAIKDTDRLYEGYGTALISIHNKNGQVVADNKATTYGASIYSGWTYSETGAVTGEKLLNPEGFACSNVRETKDADDYTIFVAGGTEDENYNVSYVTGNHTIERKDIDVTSGVLVGTDLESTLGEIQAAAYSTDHERMYGEYNEITDFAENGLIYGDSLADIIKGAVIAKYNKVITSDANVTYPDHDVFVDGFTDDYYVELAEGNFDTRNYNITFIDGVENIFQRPIEVQIVQPFAVEDNTKYAEALQYTTVTTSKHNGEGDLAVHTDYKDPNYINDTIDDLDLFFILGGTVKAPTDTVQAGVHNVGVGNTNYYAGDNKFELVNKDDDNKVTINPSRIALTAVISDKTRTSFKVYIANSYDNTPLANITGIAFKVINTSSGRTVRAGTLSVDGGGYYSASYSRLDDGDYRIEFEKAGYTFDYNY